MRLINAIAYYFFRTYESSLVPLINDFVYPDQTVRPFGDSNDTEGWCVYKRWAEYASGQELWMWPCADAASPNSNKAGKYWWSYDESTGQVRSEGSFLQRPHKPFCWFVIRPESMYFQRLKIKVCDFADETQRFRMIDGRIFPEVNPRICVGHEVGTDGGVFKVSVGLSKCYSNNYGRVEVVQQEIEEKSCQIADVEQSEIDALLDAARTEAREEAYVAGREDGHRLVENTFNIF